jgi:drug/metabolite transporter (DMT)-like permease
MHPTHRPLDAFAIGVVLVLSLSWGFNQVSVKLSLPDIPPFLQGAIRSAGAAAFGRDGSLRPGLLAGFLFGLEFLLLYPALLFTTATRAAVFLYLAPFFVVLGARWFLPADRFSRPQWIGLGLAFAGMLLAFGLPTPAADPRQWVGDAMMVLAAACWAGTTLVVKASALNRIPFEKAMLYQLVVSALMLGLAALAFGERIAGTPSAVALGAMIYQTFWVVPVTFVAWFGLVQRYSASRLSAFTFLTPIFGVLAGHLVLGEPLTPAFVAACVLVLAGLVLVNRPR